MKCPFCFNEMIIREESIIPNEKLFECSCLIKKSNSVFVRTKENILVYYYLPLENYEIIATSKNRGSYFIDQTTLYANNLMPEITRKNFYNLDEYSADQILKKMLNLRAFK